MKKIIYTRPDGGVSVVHPVSKDVVGKFVPQVLNMTEDEFIEWIKAKDVPADASNVKIVDASYIPADRSNRDEWVDKGDKIEADAIKVQEKEALIADADAEKASVLSKLGISAEDAEILLKKGGVK